ncbi:type-2 ice-structuring protein-like [Xyrichtys novacula]|uniref:Type-2 ice-structuring protein-like n=1 Tax=Xyrichtys novacula TaxID=13765 RepID=A0AAV1HIH6_XYRNO|nr:type-2 ice-structuring protein-like [Xyrichtys novacula]
MKLLAVSALLCAVVALTGAFVLPADEQQELENFLDKRAACTGAWTEFNGRCFRYFPRALTWAAAEKNCQSLGGNLASIQNIEEYHEIQRLIVAGSYNLQLAWVGGNLAHQVTSWLWSDGTRFTYENWCQGDPQNGSGNNCMQVNYSESKCWNDGNCNEVLPFVCSTRA